MNGLIYISSGLLHERLVATWIAILGFVLSEERDGGIYIRFPSSKSPVDGDACMAFSSWKG